MPKLCSKCNTLLDANTKKTRNAGSYCDGCARVYAKEYRRNYYKLNREKIKNDVAKTRNFYLKKLRDNNPLFKEGIAIRHKIRKIIRRNKAVSGIEDLLGCTKEYFKKHIEDQFDIDMSWENYGEWHLDHIKPTSLAKTREELHDLFHYTNTQPLWAKNNQTKGKKVS